MKSSVGIHKVVARKFTSSRKNGFASSMVSTDWFSLVKSEPSHDACAGLLLQTLFGVIQLLICREDYSHKAVG